MFNQDSFIISQLEVSEVLAVRLKYDLNSLTPAGGGSESSNPAAVGDLW